MSAEEVPVFPESMYVTYGGRRMLKVMGGEGDVPDAPAAAPPPAPEVEAPPAPEPTGPWADKLTSFEDPQIRSQVDSFLRENVQPYVTKLEQERPQVDEGAIKLWNDINGENPAQAYLSLTGELFDPEVAELVQSALEDYYADPNAQTPAPDADPNAQTPPRDPEVQALIDAENERKYNEAVTTQLAEHKIPEQWHDMIHPLVYSNEGDVKAAAKALADKLTAAGIQLGEAPPTVEDVPDPPGVPSPTPPAPPVEKKYDSIDAALDDFLAEQRTVAPPSVGGV